jgi:hypothetical protein
MGGCLWAIWIARFADGKDDPDDAICIALLGVNSVDAIPQYATHSLS